MADRSMGGASGTPAERKRGGRVYTPAPLAALLARRALAALSPPAPATGRPPPRRIDVLDPACGDGALLAAVLEEARREPWRHLAPRLRGVDVDPAACARARRRLGRAARITGGDFLAADAAGPPRRSDLVIANPPYVRTQALGAARAAALRRRFGLAGRVDLLHAFVAAAGLRLVEGGVLAFLGSNRVLTTRAGLGVRRLLADRFELLEVIDLGDTRLFDAAVLPAIVVARRAAGAPFRPRGRRVYLARSGGPAPGAEEVVAAVEGRGRDGALRVESGAVVREAEHGPWRITPPAEARFLVHVRGRAAATFGEHLHVRVGVKTTADDVFVRETFDDLPEDRRPEPALVRPLLRREHAAPFVASSGAPRALLYPHEVVRGRRRAVDLERYPLARAWLERHRGRLEARAYLAAAGRRWYEVWVPHDPDGWRGEKVVFPDISERPRFFLDRSGAVVPGSCYWMVPRDGDPRVLRLALAVANSSLALRFYDAACGNRLYHGRRRFITQYVARFPLPDPDGPLARELIGRVEERLRSGVDPAADAVIDALVERRLGDVPAPPARPLTDTPGA